MGLIHYLLYFNHLNFQIAKFGSLKKLNTMAKQVDPLQCHYLETYHLKKHTNVVMDANQVRNILMNFLRSNKLPSVYIECLSSQFCGVL